MGYLLKQALKSICGANHWSYAVFWKSGVQNPKLLIWEECYMSNSDTDNGNKQLTLEELDMCWRTPGTRGSGFGVQLQDKVQLLVNKMMMANQVHVIGEGLVGRTGFAGNHQWIISGNYNANGYPPEVINELNVQFSAGMQTIAVIPVIPLGVLQLGSSLAIMENIGFIQNVRDLILQLERVPIALRQNFPDTGDYSRYIGTPSNEMTSGLMDTLGDMRMLDPGSMFAGDMNSFKGPRFVNNSSHPVLCEVGNKLQVKAPTFEVSTQNVSRSLGDNSCQSLEKETFSSYIAPKQHFGNKYGWVEAIPVRSDMVPNQHASLIRSGSGCSYGQTANSNYIQNPWLLDAFKGHGVDQTSSSCTSVMTSQLNANEIQYKCVVEQPITSVVSGSSYSGKRCKPACVSVKGEENDLSYTGKMPSAWPSREHIPDSNKFCGTKHYTQGINDIVEENLNQSSGRDDLFDIVGMEFNNKIMQGYAYDIDENVGANPRDELKKDKFEELTSFPNTKDDWFSESGTLSSSVSDHLLEAVVSGIHNDSTTQSTTDGNLYCRTTPTRFGSCVPVKSLKFNPVNMSDSIYEKSGHTEPAQRSIEVGPTVIKPSFGKEKSGKIPQISSSYGSHCSSWVEQGPVLKHESSSIATANSRKSAEFIGKPNRKRLKAGESPRPRPKDRQMIQDRVKELREMIPNGAKCSIDALLERTIKHMLFLQSVTKHADKLKHMTDKSIDEYGGSPVNDNFELGATWAYEVGSQAMVCPIVVEDLNPPRKLLVKMLCEEKGFFLEIADMIRGMGLTILKGVMESRNDKIWARFAVEADRDVTRMEVFISLVHLLEQAGKGDNAPPVEDDDRSVNSLGVDQVAAASMTANKNQQLIYVKSQVMC